MKKKVFFIIIFVILFITLIGFYNFSNHKEENEINNNTSVVTENKNEEKLNTTTNLDTTQNNEVTNNLATTENTQVTDTKVNTQPSTEKIEQLYVSPSGFIGSSLYRVVLYSNGEAYVRTFDGNGYEKSNIIEEELIAKNVQSIKIAEDEEHFGEVIIKGGESTSHKFGWIVFE